MNYRSKVEKFFNQTLDGLYPIRLGDNLSKFGDLNKSKIFINQLMINNILPKNIDLEEVLYDYVEKLKEIKIELNKDVEAIFNGDPAAKSFEEIIIAYPGFFAIAAYRIANFLLQKNVPLIPRIITEHAHSYTGIDIHPAAKIGNYFCIDHGTGVVIGETTIIGNNVKIYQGVTLGALSVSKKNVEGKRHPTIKDNVVIYAQATILGGKTIVGKNTIIGGNVWITKSIPANSKVYYNAKANISSRNIMEYAKLNVVK